MINIKRIVISGDVPLASKEQIDQVRSMLSDLIGVEQSHINCTYEEVPDEEPAQ
jgi:hypothetical protein